MTVAFMREQNARGQARQSPIAHSYGVAGAFVVPMMSTGVAPREPVRAMYRGGIGQRAQERPPVAKPRLTCGVRASNISASRL